MQNKGVIRFLAICLALASAFQLSFSVRTSMVRNNAEKYAAGDIQKEAKYLDSIGNEVVYNFFWIRKYTYKECLERELNFGLDLKGGMNVILEVSVPDVVNALSNNSKDENFLKAMSEAKKAQRNSGEDFITLFGKAFNQVAPQGKLASIFNTVDLKDRISFNSTNDEVLAVLREESNAAISNSFNILRTRIDRFGVTQPNIQRLSGETGRILVELPGVKDPERVKKLLQGTANLEFWETYDVKEVWGALTQANAKLKDLLKSGNSPEKVQPVEIVPVADSISKDTLTNADTVAVAKADTSAKKESLLDQIDSSKTDIALAQDSGAVQSNGTLAQFTKDNPLFAVLQPVTDQSGQLYGGASVGHADAKDTDKVNKYLAIQQIKDLFPRDIKFCWTVKPADWDKSGTRFELIALRITNRDGSACLTGDAVTNAREEFDDKSASALVSMTMNGEGAKEWARITKRNIGKQVAIVLDNYVYSYPVVQNEITGGNSQISGHFTVNEAKDLANILKSGKLPAPAKVIEEEVVGPSLGQAAINSGMWSFLGAFIVVLLYMLLYYRTAGVAANLALFANVFLLIGVLASVGAVLTLPGIAGIVLTMGMAVDANVIIYERIREEMHAGKGLKQAVKDGYKESYSAIIDGNVTTILTGLILFIFGHGPIQGFATTLVLGILTTLFTAIFISRLFFQRMLDKDKEIKFWSKWNEFALKNTVIDFMKARKTAYIISGIVIIISLVSMFTKGFDQGVDFVGGRTYVVKFDKSVNTVDVMDLLAKDFGSEPQVKTLGADNQVKIITKYLIDEDNPETDAKVQDILFNDLKTLYTNQTFTKEMFVTGFVVDPSGNAQLNDDENIATLGLQSSSKVGPTIADDIKVSAILSIVFALIVMFFYIFVRFKNWQYGLGAVIALIHDATIVMGVFSLCSGFLPFSMEIDQSFIAAILTIVGYSVNDTVIIFDRIREYTGLYVKTPFLDNINGAINSTLSRTVNTSLTTLFTLLVIFIFGGEVIRGFVFALLIGISVGTYSSIFVASSISYDTVKRFKLKGEDEALAVSQNAK